MQTCLVLDMEAKSLLQTLPFLQHLHRTDPPISILNSASAPLPIDCRSSPPPLWNHALILTRIFFLMGPSRTAILQFVAKSN